MYENTRGQGEGETDLGPINKEYPGVQQYKNLVEALDILPPPLRSIPLSRPLSPPTCRWNPAGGTVGGEYRAVYPPITNISASPLPALRDHFPPQPVAIYCRLHSGFTNHKGHNSAIRGWWSRELEFAIIFHIHMLNRRYILQQQLSQLLFAWVNPCSVSWHCSPFYLTPRRSHLAPREVFKQKGFTRLLYIYISRVLMSRASFTTALINSLCLGPQNLKGWTTTKFIVNKRISYTAI